MRVSRDHGPVAVVVHARLGELQLERVRADLDGLDAGVLLDWDTILVPVGLMFRGGNYCFFSNQIYIHTFNS